MSNEFLGDRRIALEEAFSAKQDAELRRRLRDMDQARRNKKALSAASGITDDAVLDKLVALNIGSETLAAAFLGSLGSGRVGGRQHRRPWRSHLRSALLTISMQRSSLRAATN